MLSSAAECQRYLETHSPADIANQLRRDQELCREGRLPSVLAHYLPPASTTLGDAISCHLLPESDDYSGGLRAVRQLQYDSVIRGIKSFLSQMDKVRSMKRPEEAKLNQIPSATEFHTTLNVLDYLSSESKVSGLTRDSTFEDVITAVRTQLSLDPALRTALGSFGSNNTKRCYICRFRLRRPHDLYAALCPPCGAFNLAGSQLSLPENLDLKGTTALVTGGRINLGSQTALRLLRCGANVIVSSRYPRDAESRYHAEPDSEQWADRLKIIGADFRTANDAFRLVVVVRKLLSKWSEAGQPRKLNVLINNAAQTLTDPLRAESKAVDRECLLRSEAGNGRLLVDNDRGYDAKVRGGMQLTWTAGLEGHNPLGIEDAGIKTQKRDENPPQKGLRGETEEDPKAAKSSWGQNMNEIPYEDMISAHSVNAFVPLILCRELIPLMATAGDLPASEGEPFPPPNNKSQAYSRPLGYIINVSSREGIFEENPGSASKRGHHVHTNMSKAAINMITETEAGPAWFKHRIAMSTVDPGYMSAAPEGYRADGCPIGFQDGAARVLWPIVAGVKDGVPVWGRFLKHFGATEIDVGLGRGNG